MLKLKLTKAEFDALPEGLKVAYLADGENYKLAVDGYEDPGELRRARDREKEAARIAKEERDAYKAKLEGLELEPARTAKDIKTLEAAWKAKYDADVAAERSKTEAATKKYSDHLVQSEARKFASEIAAKPENVDLILPHVLGRFEFSEDTVRIKDKTGRLSAMNTDELKKEFVENPMFGSVVAASKASGAGGAGNSNPSSGGAGKTAGKKFSDWSENERVELYRSNPAEFQRLSEASRSAVR